MLQRCLCVTFTFKSTHRYELGSTSEFTHRRDECHSNRFDTKNIAELRVNKTIIVKSMKLALIGPDTNHPRHLARAFSAENSQSDLNLEWNLGSRARSLVVSQQCSPPSRSGST